MKKSIALNVLIAVAIGTFVGCSSSEPTVTKPTPEFLADQEKKQKDYAASMAESYKNSPTGN